MRSVDGERDQEHWPEIHRAVLVSAGFAEHWHARCNSHSRQPAEDSRAFPKQKVEDIMLRNTLLSSVALFGWLGLAAGSASAYDHHGGHGGHHHHSAHHHSGHPHHSYSGYSQYQLYRPQVVVAPSYGYSQPSCQYYGYSGGAYGGYGGYGGYGSPYGGMGYGGRSGFGLYYSR